jgi:hypothetical protein
MHTGTDDDGSRTMYCLYFLVSEITICMENGHSKDQTFMKIKWFNSMGRCHLLFNSNKLSISIMCSCPKLLNENAGENREKLMEE